MIQRIQTIYLLVAVILAAMSLCFPIGTFMANGADVAHAYCLWVQPAAAGSSPSFATLPLFCVLLLVALLSGYAIFAFTNRLYQSRLCLFCVMLLVGWHVLYAAYAFLYSPVPEGEACRFLPSPAAVLPLLTLVFCLLARRAIIADEKLVRAADRIR
ncbi:MAG: DUF4293 domain-containing protein [Prevotella sp.]